MYRRVMLSTTSKKYKQKHTNRARDYTRALNKSESPDAELIKRALLSLRFFPPAPNFPHLHRLLAVTYREDHGSIGAETALADGARVRSDAHEAAAGGERVHADRVGVRRNYGLGNVR